MAGLFGTWAWEGPRKNPWNTKMRAINDALRAIGFNPAQRHKPNVGLLFALAQWGQRQSKLPKKSLHAYLDDGHLFEILRIHRQVPIEAYGLCDLTPEHLNKLEKRLHRLWPSVRLMIDAMETPRNMLRTQNQKRRKPAHLKQKSRVSTLSATLAQFNS